MLKRLLNGRKKPASSAAIQLRQASDVSNVDHYTRMSGVELQGAASIVTQIHAHQVNAAEPDILDRGHITDVRQLPDWRTIVQDVVLKSDLLSCVVLDLHMRAVLVLATPDFFAGSSYQALLHNLGANKWIVDKQLTCSAGLIKLVHQLGEQRRPSSKSNESDEEHNSQLYKDINWHAYSLRASDIHYSLNLHEETSLVRIRIDGKMRDWKNFDTQVLRDALSAGYNGLSIKGTNSAPSWGTERQISTMTRFSQGAVTLNGRLSTQPTSDGCYIVTRIIDATTGTLANCRLQDLGFTDQQVDEELMPSLARDKGFILISGSTGDGKTTTLQYMLSVLPNRGEKALLGVEDPNEMKVPGMQHVSIQRNPDDTQEQMRRKFDAALMQSLRMDPDVIMQGEVRDHVSGQFASDVVMTGHLWLGTLHGNDALNSIFRLMAPKIGVAPDILASKKNFVASIAQKLLPKLCLNCRLPAADVMPAQDLALFRQKFQLTSELYCADTNGCDHCRVSADIAGDGEIGRIAAAEIIANPTDEFLAYVLARDEEGARRTWRRTRRAPFNKPDMRGKTAFEHGLYSVSQGIVSPIALQNVFGFHFSDYEVLDLNLQMKGVA